MFGIPIISSNSPVSLAMNESLKSRSTACSMSAPINVTDQFVLAFAVGLKIVTLALLRFPGGWTKTSPMDTTWPFIIMLKLPKKSSGLFSGAVKLKSNDTFSGADFVVKFRHFERPLFLAPS